MSAPLEYQKKTEGTKLDLLPYFFREGGKIEMVVVVLWKIYLVNLVHRHIFLGGLVINV